MYQILQDFLPWIFGRNMNNKLQMPLNLPKEINALRKEFKEYTGGSVDLILNDNTGIALLCLNHPERKNSITGKMMVDLEAAIGKLEAWTHGKGLIIYGADHNFCSGGDHEFVHKINNPVDGYKMATFMQNVLCRLQDLPLITVAFIEGSGALGGGAELAIACDFRLMSTNPMTGIGFVHAKMGIIPAWGGNYMLHRLLGYQLALDLITTGRILGADEAKRIGLVSDSLDTFHQAIDWLKDRIKYDVSVIRAAKLVAVKVRQRDADLLEQEKRIFSPLWGGMANKVALGSHIKHRL